MPPALCDIPWYLSTWWVWSSDLRTKGVTYHYHWVANTVLSINLAQGSLLQVILDIYHCSRNGVCSCPGSVWCRYRTYHLEVKKIYCVVYHIISILAVVIDYVISHRVRPQGALSISYGWSDQSYHHIPRCIQSIRLEYMSYIDPSVYYECRSVIHYRACNTPLDSFRIIRISVSWYTARLYKM